MSDLRSKVIRLAHARPELRGQLLPLLKQAAKAPAKLTGKKLDALISKTYSVLGNGVRIMLMDIPQIYHNALKAYEGAGTPEEATEALEKAMKTSIAKHKTPLTSGEEP